MLAYLAAFQVDEHIAAGKLVPVLEAFHSPALVDTHAVYLGHHGKLPARIRAVLDFLQENMRIGNGEGMVAEHGRVAASWMADG
ncbi:type 2 periplasmic-binding domain-containing protein [Gluconacetobacter diazotrophicus]|uniref:hypothetical protein n=1 Tax=Gluconacetobacter diazotrophicus TaxID=33996 RepID=UPI000173C07B|nr:hypothetical protein [Gluconacetobacter diazotrophicus]TWB03051.1 hypothetical protein FBZ86_1231 [Gluconacetobacter diazotrophicus]